MGLGCPVPARPLGHLKVCRNILPARVNAPACVIPAVEGKHQLKVPVLFMALPALRA